MIGLHIYLMFSLALSASAESKSIYAQRLDRPDEMYELKANQPTLLVFWTQKCSECQTSRREATNLLNDAKMKGLQVVEVYTSGGEPLDRSKLNSRVNVVEIQDAGGRIGEKFNVDTSPTWVFVGRNGEVVGKAGFAPQRSALSRRMQAYFGGHK